MTNADFYKASGAVTKHPRDRATGRYKHEWGFIGNATETQGEIAECQLCGKIRESLAAGDRFYRNIEAARKAGRVFLEGY